MNETSSIPLNRKGKHIVNKRSNTISTPVLGLGMLITSFFYCLPLGRLSLGGLNTDFRIYDFVFIGFLLMVGLPNINRIKNVFVNRKLFFRWGLLVVFLAIISLIITAVTSGLNTLLIASIRVFRFMMYFLTPGFILAFVDTPKKQNFLLTLFYFNVVVQMILSVMQYYDVLPNFWPAYWLAGYGDLPVGTLSPHHKHIGVVMLLGVALSLFYLQNSRSILNKIIVLMFMGGMFAVSIFSVSRTSWLGLIALFAAFMYIQKTKAIFPIIFISIGLLTFYFASPDIFKADLQSNVDMVLFDRIEAQGIEGITGDRMKVYDNIPDAIGKFPWIIITGTGFQNISFALRASGAHNNYLQAWFELGIFGFILYMIFLIRIVKNLLLVRNQKINRKQYLLSSSIFVGFVGVLATMLVGESLWAQYSMFTLSGQILTMVALGCAPLLWKGSSSQP